MLKVGITGGIGSGKSVVCRVFSTLGIPVFNADDAAKYLMEHDRQLVASITALLGADAYANGKPNREKISSIIFGSPDKLQQLNALVHPATIRYANEWMNKQTSPYVIKEAAIFFESDSYKEMDTMAGVYAPVGLRIERAMKRSNISYEKVVGIMGQQMNEDDKMKRCDHVIVNDDAQAVLPQVLQLHELFLALSNTHSPKK